MNNISIGVFGTVSTGKTTFINALFANQYSDTNIRRTTMVPQVYTENIDYDYANNILSTNRSLNKEISDNIENNNITLEDIQEFSHKVPLIADINRPTDIILSFYDLPGINDSQTKSIYVDYLQQNFHKFDIVIWIIDINSALNTSDEMDLLKMIATKISENKTKYNINTKLLVLVNKCDDMIIENDNFIFHSNEISEMYDQIVSIIKSTIGEIKYDICPISCEYAYIYRMYKKNPNIELETKYMDKFGFNEYGKNTWNKLSIADKKMYINQFISSSDYEERINTTGFNYFKNIISNHISDAYHLLINKIKYQIIIADIKSDIEYNQLLILNYFVQEIIYVNNLCSHKSESDHTDLSIVFYNKFINCCNLYNIKISNFLNDIDIKKNIQEYINDSTNKTYHQLLQYKSLYDDFILLLNKIKDCQLFAQSSNHIFDQIKTSVSTTLENIISAIHYYNITAIRITNCFNKIIIHIDELMKYQYNNCKKIIQVSILSSDFVKKFPEDQVKILCLVLDKYCLNNTDIINLIFNLLDSVYSIEIEQNSDSDECTKKYFSKYHFWNNILIRSSNEYSPAITELKFLLQKFLIKPPNDQVDLDNSVILEKFLLDILIKEYPKDICSHDKIIDFINANNY